MWRNVRTSGCCRSPCGATSRGPPFARPECGRSRESHRWARPSTLPRGSSDRCRRPPTQPSPGSRRWRRAEFQSGQNEAATAVARLARSRAPDEPGMMRLLAFASDWYPGHEIAHERRAAVAVARGDAYRELGDIERRGDRVPLGPGPGGRAGARAPGPRVAAHARRELPGVAEVAPRGAATGDLRRDRGGQRMVDCPGPAAHGGDRPGPGADRHVDAQGRRRISSARRATSSSRRGGSVRCSPGGR